MRFSVPLFSHLHLEGNSSPHLSNVVRLGEMSHSAWLARGEHLLGDSASGLGLERTVFIRVCRLDCDLESDLFANNSRVNCAALFRALLPLWLPAWSLDCCFGDWQTPGFSSNQVHTAGI